MSMLLMVEAMKLKVGNPLRKLVLIKLADNASDKGECFPSIAYIADQCEISERSVQNHIKQLEADGLLKIESRKTENGLNRSNIYYLNFSGVNASGYGANNFKSGANAAPSGESTAPHTGANAAPRISNSIEPVNEPVKEPKKKSFDPISVKPKNLSLETWMSWIEYKSDKKQKLLPSTWKAQSKMLEAQQDPESVINLSIMNNWQGLFPEKVNPKTGNNKNQPGKTFASQNYGETKQPDWARG